MNVSDCIGFFNCDMLTNISINFFVVVFVLIDIYRSARNILLLLNPCICLSVLLWFLKGYQGCFVVYVQVYEFFIEVFDSNFWVLQLHMNYFYFHCIGRKNYYGWPLDTFVAISYTNLSIVDIVLYLSSNYSFLLEENSKMKLVLMEKWEMSW